MDSPKENSDSKLKPTETHQAPNYAFLSTSNTQTPPLTLPLFRPVIKPNNLLNLDALHKSLASTVDKCFRLLHHFASRNQFIERIVALHSGFRSICQQIHCRNIRNMNSLSNLNFAAVLPGDSVAGLVVANGILNFLNIYNTLLVVRLVLTWFPNAPPAVVNPLSTICDPYLNIFRGIIPPLGGTLDFSPILAFLVLNAFTSTAAALPAELPATLSSQDNPASCATSISTSQKKWMRRLRGDKPKSPTSPF